MTTTLERPSRTYKSALRRSSDALLTTAVDHRVIAIGQTGTGKSTLMRYLLERRLDRYNRQLAIVDSKGDFTPPRQYWRGGSLERKLQYCTTAQDAADRIRRGHHVLYRPHPEELELEQFDQVYSAIFWRGHIDVYTDELRLSCKDAGRYPRYLAACYAQGRSRGIAAMGGTQRPATVPVVCMSECEYWYVGHLSWIDDRARVRNMIGDIEIPDRHTFARWDVYSKRPQLMRLEIR